MGAPLKGPGPKELEMYLRKGMTQAQIAAKWEAETGMRVSRSTIAMAIARYGLESAHKRPRYEEWLPWKVRQAHQMHNDARMLRLYARFRQGQALGEKDKRILDAWYRELREKNAVIGYDPETPEGFHWLRRVPSDDPDDLIRRPRKRVRK